MNKQHRRMQVAANLCLELGEDDGIDPRYLARKSARSPSARKSLQVSKEAMRVFSLVLAGECRQRVLRDVQIVSVVPEREGQLLLVTATSVSRFNAGQFENPFGLSPSIELRRALSKPELNRPSTSSGRTVNKNWVNQEQRQTDGDLVLAALKQVQGQLRAALAQAVNRKHTPELAFRYVGAMAFEKADKVGQEVVHAD